MVGGSGVVLRDAFDDKTAALDISPLDTSSIAPDTSSISSGSTHRYTVRNIAAASAGTGIPLLCALLIAVFLLLRKQRQQRQQVYRPSRPEGYDNLPPTPSTTYYAELMQQTLPRPPKIHEASSEREPSELEEVR
ncbi:hypothetical protein LTR97_002615 [Elasticomyces elasticus]|uniref:Uncharacterized protein n=1 Tax=Elasticomyces elasticus TaxID=574655 RepID=A0AAN7VWE8_9PEZI|nr:hypothetical protein LTR97_002615 [Elasticomyces elasticus]